MSLVWCGIFKILYYRMKPSSCKSKGRVLQNEVKSRIMKKYRLGEDDVRSTPMGCKGEDIQLSTHARSLFPFSVECKNTETINVWSALSQSEKNCGGNIPLLVFKRNKSAVYCALKFDSFLSFLNDRDESDIICAELLVKLRYS